jgi:hypothetical protein
LTDDSTVVSASVFPQAALGLKNAKSNLDFNLACDSWLFVALA